MTDGKLALESLARIGKILATKIPNNPSANKDYSIVLSTLKSLEATSPEDIWIWKVLPTEHHVWGTSLPIESQRHRIKDEKKYVPANSIEIVTYRELQDTVGRLNTARLIRLCAGKTMRIVEGE